MKKDLTILFFLNLLLFSSVTQLFAAEKYAGSFLLHLYYESESLKLDGDEIGELTIESSTVDFVPPTRSYPLYTASLYDKNNNFLISAKIDQRGGNSEIKSGIVTIIAPFDKKTDRVEISNETGKKIISLSIWGLCNYNKICDSSLGETGGNCSEDCVPKPSATQPSPTPSIKQTLSSSGNRWVMGIWIFSGIILAAGLTMIYIAKKRRES
ncbi:MAG: hypothetical protein UT37_C0008G0015 [Parcubacteria group bacterium GW2011_GWA2_39_18]|nr:MAG: hypothetical protein UT37_C0008G0015 [Parcubacteria group bacterium GW2011_GWA2_39_18]